MATLDELLNEIKGLRSTLSPDPTKGTASKPDPAHVDRDTDLLRLWTRQVTHKEFVEYLIDRAGQAAGKRVNFGEAIWRSVTALFLFGIAFLGYTHINEIEKKVAGEVKTALQTETEEKFEKLRTRTENQIANLRTDFSARVDAQSQAAVGAALKDSLGKIQEETVRQSDLLSLLVQSMSMEAAQSFTNSERDSVIGLIEKISKDDKTTSRPEFATAIEKNVSSFHKANVTDGIDRIYGAATSLCLSNNDILQTLLEHYSRRILSLSDRSQAMDLYETKYKQVASAASRSALSAFAFPMDMIILHDLKGTDARDLILRMLEELDSMESTKVRLILAVIEGMQDPKQLAKDPSNINARRVAEATKSFVAAYRDQLNAINAKPRPSKGADQ